MFKHWTTLARSRPRQRCKKDPCVQKRQHEVWRTAVTCCISIFMSLIGQRWQQQHHIAGMCVYYESNSSYPICPQQAQDSQRAECLRRLDHFYGGSTRRWQLSAKMRNNNVECIEVVRFRPHTHWAVIQINLLDPYCRNSKEKCVPAFILSLILLE